MLHSCLFVAFLAMSVVSTGDPPAPKPPPPRSEVESLVRRYYQDVAAQSDEAKSSRAADELLSEDFFFTFGMKPVLTRGIEAHKKWLIWHHRAGADQVWTLQDLVIENDTAAVRFLLSSKHQATFAGIPATGRTITTRGMDFFRISAGRIVELYRVFDGCDVLNQMGAACPPPPPPAVTPTPRP